ncbi:hypothetical protein PCANC_14472 [Puccinia coronata f. sp. avenae]|uniref:Secreted protein n=1 Tax=Puccinia coronata f. sp. avenae TaxID=200324 RepID=A0A2N5USG1_9BASI|nr:hypothetical protein PCANC_14472 [Puccinia coronata f. sp. avenae]PLW44160.1 hypothetical protein PCASD_09570 [Puccinia coronata f. sp. avenae]
MLAITVLYWLAHSHSSRCCIKPYGIPPKIAKFCWHKTFQVGHEPSIRHLIHSRWPVRDVPPKKGKKICIRFPGKKNMLQRPL